MAERLRSGASSPDEGGKGWGRQEAAESHWPRPRELEIPRV